MTPIAAEGLALNNGQHAYITHDAVDFSLYIATLLTNKNQWLLFNNESRSLMLQDYTWDNVLKNIDKSLAEA
jgi:malate synthase